jgi:hypothetical protein
MDNANSKAPLRLVRMAIKDGPREGFLGAAGLLWPE